MFWIFCFFFFENILAAVLNMTIKMYIYPILASNIAYINLFFKQKYFNFLYWLEIFIMIFSYDITCVVLGYIVNAYIYILSV